MGFIDKLKYHAFDSTGAVAGLIEKWTPRRCKTEKDYENSLYEYLHQELGGVQVTKQFAKGRIRADLAIGDQVIIELKHNLDETGKYQRLIGQLEGYKDWEGQVIIVLTGATDRNLRKELDEYVKKHRSLLLLQADKFTVVEK